MKIGFYVGEEKTDIGNWPYMTLLAIAAGVMILSEVMILMNFSLLKFWMFFDTAFLRNLKVSTVLRASF